MTIRTCPNGSETQVLSLELAYIAAIDIEFIAGIIATPVLSFILWTYVDAAFDVATLCNSDPPDPPTFNAFDFLDPAQLDGKIKQLIQSVMWDVWCQ